MTPPPIFSSEDKLLACCLFFSERLFHILIGGNYTLCSTINQRNSTHIDRPKLATNNCPKRLFLAQWSARALSFHEGSPRFKSRHQQFPVGSMDKYL